MKEDVSGELLGVSADGVGVSGVKAGVSRDTVVMYNTTKHNSDATYICNMQVCVLGNEVFH